MGKLISKDVRLMYRETLKVTWQYCTQHVCLICCPKNSYSWYLLFDLAFLVDILAIKVALELYMFDPHHPRACTNTIISFTYAHIGKQPLCCSAGMTTCEFRLFQLLKFFCCYIRFRFQRSTIEGCNCVPQEIMYLWRRFALNPDVIYENVLCLCYVWHFRFRRARLICVHFIGLSEHIMRPDPVLLANLRGRRLRT